MKKLIKTLVVTSIFTFSFILSACGDNNQTQQENHTSCYFSNWETLRPATCHDEGEEIGYCECGNTQIRNVPMTNHNYHEYIEREPSCQEEGTIVTECSECGERHFKSIPVTEHAYVEVNHVEATCDQQGYTIFSCQQCGHEKHDNFVTGTQHIYSEFEVTEIPTYLVNGEAVRYCENNSSHVETVTLPSLDSNEYNSFMVGGGMCGQDQIYEYIYNYQGYQIRFEVVFPNEHDFEEFYHDATCEDPAVKGQICRNCGYIEEHIVAAPLQHYYGPWQISQLPTEYSGGEAIRTCYKDNNHIETLTLPALYSYEYNKQLIQGGSCISDAIYTYSYYDFISFEIVVEGEGHQLDYYSNLQPTCEEKGYESYEKCRLCDYTTYQEIPAKGHNLSPWETIFNATCETNGLKGRNCYECEYYEHEDIITSGHDLTYYEKLDSTCYSDGHEAYEQCSKCSYTTYQKIVAKQHYNENASCKEYVVCDYCNDYFILPHKYENIKFDSYSHWKECECGQQAYYSSHNISDWYFTEVPSCDKEGIREHKCIECDYKYSEVALISHDYVDNHCIHCNALKPSENLYFELLDDGTLEVSIGSCMDSYVVIPQVYENMYVSKIADSGFYNCDFISQVYIANTITSIGKYAFANCDNLTEITVSSNTLLYNEQAFNGTNISKVNFDGEIEKWVEITFADHKATPLNNKADFYLYQTGELVENIEILNEVNVINDYAFYGFNSLKTISLPSSLTTIGASSFDKCDNLIFNEYDNAYYLGNATNNYMVLFKAKDSNIESCNVHENAFYIYKNAFLNCTNLKSFEIKENIKYVGKDILKGCSSLESLTVAFTGEDRDSNAELGYLFGKVSYSGSYLADTDYYIPNTLNTVTFNTTKVKSDELNGYTSLNEVILADSVKSIGSRAFANCGAIKLNIPSSIESIGIEFIQNTTMSKYYIYEDGLYIGNEQDKYLILYQMYPDRNPYHFEVNENTKFIYSFSNKISNQVLTEIVIHANVKGILHNFDETPTLQRVYYKGSMDDWSQITFNQSKNNPMSVATEFYVDENGYNEVTSINISSNITQIRNYAFYGFDNVTSITIPDSVTSLGYGVFGQCNKLEELTIPYIPTRNINYQTYYRLAFYFDVLDNSEITKTLKTLKIVNNKMDIIIPENSLSNLTNLTDLYIIGDVISVGNDAFYQDNKLTLLSEDSLNSLVPILNWNFYEGLIEPDQMDDNVHAPQLLQIGDFSNFNKNDTSTNCGTYRATIYSYSEDEFISLQLYLPEVMSACKVYANDILIHEVGKVSDNENEYQGKIQNQNITITFKHSVDIIIQVANFSHYYGGIYYPPLVANIGTMQTYLTLSTVAYSLIFSLAILVMISCFSVYFFKSKKDTLYRWTGLLALAFAMYIFYPIFHMIGTTSIRFMYLMENLGSIGISVLMLIICTNLTKRTTQIKTINTILIVSSIAIMLITTLFNFVSEINNLVQIVSIIVRILIALYILIISIINVIKENRMMTVFIASLIYATGVIFDCFVASYYDPYYFLYPIETGTFASLIVFLISTFAYNIKTNKENKKLNTNLISEVSSRTEKMRNLISERRDFVSSVAHDLKSPISSLSLFIQKLQTKELTKKEQEKIFEVMEDKLKQLTNNLTMVQNFNNLDLIEDKMQNTEMCAFVKQIYEEFLPETEAEGIHLKHKAPLGVKIYAQIMPAKVKRAIENILFNALSFTDEDGEISLTLKTNSKNVILEIEDNGQGMTPEVQEHIFERFFSFREKETNSTFSNDGLGLYYAKLVIDECGGEINVQSQYDVGTKFIITFPTA